MWGWIWDLAPPQPGSVTTVGDQSRGDCRLQGVAFSHFSTLGKHHPMSLLAHGFFWVSCRAADLHRNIPALG